jgi:hypothetical protein
MARDEDEDYRLPLGAPEETHDLAGSGMTPELRLLEYRLAFTQHLEATATRRDHFDPCSWERLSNLGRQTGGPRLVGSNRAVLDRDRHRRAARVNDSDRRRTRGEI